MSRILLDTSAYSAYTGGHPDLQEPVRHASMVHLSVVAVGELLAGFLKGGRRRQNETRLREFAAEPRVWKHRSRPDHLSSDHRYP
jgi:predicted nucleic acid-binding protein